MNKPVLPPGPRTRIPFAAALAFRNDPLTFLSTIAHKYGDVAIFRIGPLSMVLLNHPDYIRDVLVTHQRNFVKHRALERSKRVLGEGLLTSEGDFHLRQRRLVQPAFHRQRIAAYGEAMVAEALRCQQGWQPGQVIDMAAEQTRLTLTIVGRTLFGSDTSGDVAVVSEAMREVFSMFNITALPFIDLLERLPIPQLRRFNMVRAKLDRIIYRMIDTRRASGEDKGDLLSMLLLAQDSEGDGTGMSDQQVRDEALTIFLAGQETTANALNWTFYLLAQHPVVRERLEAELDTVLAGRPPTVADLPQLRYCEMVLAESMRFYPPVWLIGRRALGEYQVGGYVFPPNTTFMMSQWVTHHDARFYTDPARFDPERWTTEAREARPKFAYYPFGGGPRVCIGEQFAWMEMILVLATMAQQWRYELLPNRPITLFPTVTLKPKDGMPMRLVHRGSYHRGD